jgi:glutamate formiminotransferase / formiminotetrahydrofolate cyclodeaminase
MKKILECVPNVSEGRNHSVIDQLKYSIESTTGVNLLHIDIGESANRTVFTFAGEPESIVEAAYHLIQASYEKIDMSKHSGTHPRIGAVDVCPLVPVSGITMDEVISYSERLASRVGNELGLPVYLYEYSSQKDYRRKLEDIRKGEYEGLKKKLQLPEWQPDYGPSVFNPKFGATVIGARKYLIAYNVNLSTSDVTIARRIAGEIRESGTVKTVNESGIIKRIHNPGILKAVKAIGWYDTRYQCAQVSTNIIDYQISPIELVFNTISEISKKYGIYVTGSEIIGMIPINSIFSDESIKKNGGVNKKMIKNIEKHLNLHFWHEKDLTDKIIELKLSGK